MMCWLNSRHEFIVDKTIEINDGNIIRDYRLICKKCGRKDIDYIKYNEFVRTNPRLVYPEWICPICDKCKHGEGWEDTKDINHIRIHLLIEIRNKPRSVVYRNCYPQWDGTDI